MILKAIHAGVGFGSWTENSSYLTQMLITLHADLAVSANLHGLVVIPGVLEVLASRKLQSTPGRKANKEVTW